MKERWLPVVGWEGLYEVSDRGAVRSVDRTVEYYHWPSGGTRAYRYRGRLLKRKYCHKGTHGKWPTVMLGNGAAGRKYLLVSRLVLSAFARRPHPGEEALHGDGIPENCLLTNLRWGTHHENSRDTVRHGRAGRPPRLSPPSVRKAIREALAQGETAASQARKYGLSRQMVCWINRGGDVQPAYAGQI